MIKNQEKRLNFRDRKLLFIDLETTGLNLDLHEIVEVGCLVVDGRSLEIVDEYHAKVIPENLKKASKEGLRISGYSKDKWKDAKALKIVLKEIVRLAPDAMVAGWKVDFDWWFLEKYFKKYKIKYSFDYHLIDVISLAYVYFREKDEPVELSLGLVCKELGVPIHEKHHEGIGHNAMDDIIATYQVFKKLVV